jgi:hypothetical protein
MRHISRAVLIVALSFGLLAMLACPTNNGDNGNGGGEYFLTVSVGEGVTGTPATGAYNYSSGASVTYNYALAAGYKDLRVLLDGAAIAPTGVITITGNRTLTASAEPLDVRGTWEGVLYDAYGTDPFRITFSGTTAASGTTSGGIQGAQVGSGTFSVANGQITFSVALAFGTWNFSASLTSETHMEGNWTWTNDPGHTWTFSFDKI